MKLVALRLALLVALAFVAFGAVSTATAAASQREPTPIVRQWQPLPQDEEQAGDRRVEPTVLWTVAGAAAGAVVFAGLYLLKRRLGGFPEHPSWVAPISVMPSRELPDETTFGEGAPAEPHASHQ